MALSRTYTLAAIEAILKIYAKDIEGGKFTPISYKEFINKNTLEFIEELPDEIKEHDYGVIVNISDDASSATNTIVTSASFTNSSRTVNKTSHGLTSSSVGKRIALWSTSTIACIAEIQSITNENNFVITKALGVNVSGTLSYAVFSAHSTTNIDLSEYNINKIILIDDSVNGQAVKARNYFEFKDLSNREQKQKNIHYFVFGETLFLYKGSSVSSYGTLSMHYHRNAVLLSDDTDFIDINDKLISQFINKCKMELYELLTGQPLNKEVN